MSDSASLPVKRVRKPFVGTRAVDSKPISQDDVRQRMLAAAGVGTERQIQLVKLAVKKYEDMLSSTKKVSLGLHNIIDIADNLSQLRAADALVELVGVLPTKDTQAVVKVNVLVNLPEWAQCIPSPPISQIAPPSQVIDTSVDSDGRYQAATTPASDVECLPAPGSPGFSTT